MVTRDVTVLIDEPSDRHASARPLGRAVNASDVMGVIVRVPFRGSEYTRLKEVYIMYYRVFFCFDLFLCQSRIIWQRMRFSRL